MFKRIKFVGIPVRDQDKALAFWTRRVTRIRCRASLAGSAAEANSRAGRPRSGSVHAQGRARAGGAGRRALWSI